MNNYKLEILDLKSEEDHALYKFQSSKIDDNNPFFKLELVLNANSFVNSLKYFHFSADVDQRILMIFNLRPIEIGSEKTPYYDVISPYGYSGPLMSQSITEESIITFWNAVNNWYIENNVITEFIRFSLNGNNKLYNGFIVPTLDNVRGIVLDESIQWDNFKTKVRNNYRKAVEHKLSFTIRCQNISQETIQSFYDIYISTMKRNTAESQYFYTIDYFQNYIKANPDFCAIATVCKDDLPVSAELILLSNTTLYSFLGGTYAEFFDSRPNDFLKINVLNWARENGYGYYLLGGGRTNGDGLYCYKKSFFPKDNDVTFYTGRKVLNLNIYKKLVSETKLIDFCSDNKKITISEGFFPGYRDKNYSTITTEKDVEEIERKNSLG